MRLFVGLSFTNKIRQRLGHLASGLENLRWVQPENYHLTLRFIGDVSAQDAFDLDLILGAIGSEPFNLKFCGLGYFGKAEKPRSIWVDIAPNEALFRLHQKVERGVISAGFGAEGRKFKPHVTLARFRSRKPRNFASYFGVNGAFSTAPFLVASFTLFESSLGHGGSDYTALNEYPLDR
jgi:2'-5' RNA ligase